MQINPTKQKTLRLAASVATAALLAMTASLGQAAPTGGNVSAGAASINSGGTSTIITQTSERATIDWQSFNLAANESVEFKVPRNSSATLNRIHDSRPSTISGVITSNGVVYFSNPNGLIFDASSSVIANGITATAGTITVNGTLQATGGSINISSTNLTTIGSNAIISVDALATGNGGRAIIWSDKHTDFHGYISARGGSDLGDGGFVEVSGKLTLNYNGQVNTLAPHGKTGTLLLDPTDITISSDTDAATSGTTTITGTAATSVVNVTTLQTALGTSNVTIDATTGTGTGRGLITVTDPILAATTGSNSLTLNGAQIIINANITMASGANLILTSTRASVWQDPTTVITAATISGEGYDGFTLNGANIITTIGTITNHGGAGISVKNAQNLAISGTTLDGGNGGVSILTPGYDLTLSNSLTVKGSFLRLDMGGSNKILGGQTITASGLDGFVTTATSGNGVTLNLGSGGFTYVTDARAQTGAVTLFGSAFTATNSAAAWGANALTTNSPRLTTITLASSGITVTANSTSGQGIVYGGTVDIEGVDSTAANPVANLTYIEGTGVAVGGLYDSNSTSPDLSNIVYFGKASQFAGALTLVASGAGFNYGDIFKNIGITILKGLRIGSSSNSDLNLIQSGVADGFRGIQVYRSGLTAGGAINLVQTGSLTTDGAYGIYGSYSTITAGGSLTLTQSGKATGLGVVFISSTMTAGGDISLNQSGRAKINGIELQYVNLYATGDIGLHQKGMIDSVVEGIRFTSSNPTGDGTGDLNTRIALIAGANRWVTIKTNDQKLSLNTNDFYTVNGGKMRIDLGSGAMVSLISSRGSTVTSPQHFGFKAEGLDVYFTGATSGNSAQIRVGNGSLTFVTDLRSVTSAVTLDSSSTASTATIGWGTGLGFSGSGSTESGVTTIDAGGITAVTNGAVSTVTRMGVVYGAAVTIDGASTSGAGALTYIEGTSITTNANASGFAGGVILRSKTSVSLGKDLSSDGAINIIASSMSLSDTITTSGGAVTILLDRGTYSDNGKTLITSGHSLSISGGRYDLTATSSFNIGNGNFRTSLTRFGNISLSDQGQINSELMDLSKVTGTGSKESILTTDGEIIIEGLTVSSRAAKLTSISGGSIELRNSNSFFGSLKLAASGTIKQTSGSLTLAAGKELTLESKLGSVSLNQAGNSLKQLGTVTAGGIASSVTIWNDGNLKFNGNITATAAIVIDLTRKVGAEGSGELTLLKNITTSGGAVTLNLGDANLNMDGFVISTSNNSLNLTAGSVTGTRQNQVIFRLGGGALSRSASLVPQAGLGEVEYYAYFAGSAALGDFVANIDPNSPGVALNFYGGPRRMVYHNSDTDIWLPVTLLTSAGAGFKIKTISGSDGLESTRQGEWVWSSKGQFVVLDEVKKLNITNRDLSFTNVTATAPVTINQVNSVQFKGINNFTNLILQGVGAVSQSPTGQLVVSGFLSVDRVLSLRLTNPLNHFSAITGATGGGSVSITTRGAVLNLDGLTTGGGSVVVVASNGGISGKYLVTGGVHFRAAGPVELNGVMASTSGTGSSVSINNTSAGWVVGNVTSDTAVTLQGSGIILTGTVTSRGSSVSVDAPVKVVGDAGIMSDSLVEVKGPIDAMTGVKDGLKLYAGNNGVINLTANIGAVTRLGWVEFYASVINRPTVISINRQLTLEPLKDNKLTVR
ncbi:MAG: filamentous hemagglutinin N-terminal domain-containing protein [Candidatus Pacebacteria bacterium]|nr:filamentous hemagglutinin N-terminal domain-containing protein [Candidatus Paceibacterota bacterium]